MLFDPSVVVAQPLQLLATVGIIVVGKTVAAYALVRAFGHDNRTALTVAASLAQIGEFSFILAALGTSLAILPVEARDLILAGAIISILLHPLVFTLVSGQATNKAPPTEKQRVTIEEEREEARSDHIILVGYGRVGKLVAAGFRRRQCGFVVVEDEPDVAREAEAEGLTVIRGNATARDVLATAGVDRARLLFLAIPEGFEAGAVAERAKRLQPELKIIARAHSDEEVRYLERFGADQVIMGEREIARVMLKALV
jgi:CPA2 family monovalent cation:H+ antiporter-2